MNSKPLCIYHGHCDDGFAAAWCVRSALGDVEFYPGVYQKDPPDVTDRDVIMVDFSYKRPIISSMAASARRLLILDHHKTAQEDLHGFLDAPKTISEWNKPENAWLGFPQVLFDMNRSGAGIAWDYLNGGNRPDFINYIEDRDLWRKSLPGGDEFTMALRSYPQDFEVWDKLVQHGPIDLIAEGKAILRYYRLRIDEFILSSYLTFINGIECWISNTPYFAASEVAGELSARPPAQFGACYFEVEHDRWQYSLRSRGDFDVSEIAKKFGGGGHKNAAGFTVNRPIHISF